MNNHTVSQTRETLIKDIGKLKLDANQVVQDASDVVYDVKNHAHAHVNETKQRVTDTYANTKEYLNSHPFSLLGAGFVIGLLFGLRLRR